MIIQPRMSGLSISWGSIDIGEFVNYNPQFTQFVGVILQRKEIPYFEWNGRTLTLVAISNGPSEYMAYQTMKKLADLSLVPVIGYEAFVNFGSGFSERDACNILFNTMQGVNDLPETIKPKVLDYRTRLLNHIRETGKEIRRGVNEYRKTTLNIGKNATTQKLILSTYEDKKITLAMYIEILYNVIGKSCESEEDFLRTKKDLFEDITYG